MSDTSFAIEAALRAASMRIRVIQPGMSDVLRLHSFGLYNLKLESAELPTLGPTDVHVRFHAASLNYRDLMVVGGKYNPKMALPRIPGSDAAGEVLAVGSQVTLFAPGDRVASLFFQDWLDGPFQPTTGKSGLGGSIDGVFATERILPQTGLIRIPDYLSYEEAATLSCAALTAWNALVEKGKLRAGQTVLLLGTGGVSLFALQIARLHGATTILTSSSDDKLARAKSLGVDHTINYRTYPDWETEVLALSGNRGVDHIVEVGGPGTLPRSFKAAAPEAHIYLIGVLSGRDEGINVMPVLQKSLHLDGVYVGSRAMFTRMNTAFQANHLRPVIDQVFPLADYSAAFENIEQGSHFGKIVLSLT